MEQLSGNRGSSNKKQIKNSIFFAPQKRKNKTPANQGKDSARPRKRLTRKEVIEKFGGNLFGSLHCRKKRANMRATAKQIPFECKQIRNNQGSLAQREPFFVSLGEDFYKKDKISLQTEKNVI